MDMKVLLGLNMSETFKHPKPHTPSIQHGQLNKVAKPTSLTLTTHRLQNKTSPSPSLISHPSRPHRPPERPLPVDLRPPPPLYNRPALPLPSLLTTEPPAITTTLSFRILCLRVRGTQSARPLPETQLRPAAWFHSKNQQGRRGGGGRDDSDCNGGAGDGRGRRGLAVVASGGGGRGRVAGAARGGARGGRAVVAAPSPGGALRGAGRARAAVPVPAGVREGDGGAHGGGLVQAHVAANLPQRAAPRARLLPLLAEDLRCVASLPPSRLPHLSLSPMCCVAEHVSPPARSV